MKQFNINLSIRADAEGAALVATLLECESCDIHSLESKSAESGKSGKRKHRGGFTHRTPLTTEEWVALFKEIDGSDPLLTSEQLSSRSKVGVSKAVTGKARNIHRAGQKGRNALNKRMASLNPPAAPALAAAVKQVFMWKG